MKFLILCVVSSHIFSRPTKSLAILFYRHHPPHNPVLVRIDGLVRSTSSHTSLVAISSRVSPVKNPSTTKEKHMMLLVVVMKGSIFLCGVRTTPMIIETRKNFRESISRNVHMNIVTNDDVNPTMRNVKLVQQWLRRRGGGPTTIVRMFPPPPNRPYGEDCPKTAELLVEEGGPTTSAIRMFPPLPNRPYGDYSCSCSSMESTVLILPPA